MMNSLAVAGDVWMAHHPLVLAIPALVPAVVVVGVVLHVARRDRQAEREERELLERGLDPRPDEPGNDETHRETP